MPSRTCAPPTGLKRFTARLVTPVKVGGTTLLPANTAAVLRLRRGLVPRRRVAIDNPSIGA